MAWSGWPLAFFYSMKRIKMLFAINCMNIGGAPSVVFEQLRRIDKTKFELFLLTLYPSKKANFFSRLSFLEPNHDIRFFLKQRSLFDLGTVFRIFRWMKTEQFDVAYTHLFLANVLVRLLAILLRVPVIFSFEHSAYTNKKRYQRIIDRLLAIGTTRIVVSTPSVATFTVASEHIPKKKFMIVPNPISLPDLGHIDRGAFRRRLGIPETACIIVSLGRFSEEKRQEDIVAAVASLIQEKRIPDIWALLVGHGSREHSLRLAIEKNNVQERCLLVVEPEKAKEYLRIADLFVISSEREGQCMALYEALMAGVPVIAPRLNTIEDVIIDRVNGLLFSPRDVRELASAIDLLYHDRDTRRSLAQEGKKTISDYAEKSDIKKFEQGICALLNP